MIRSQRTGVRRTQVFSTAAGLAAGYALDRIAADPRRGHPVAVFGRLAADAERHLYRDSRWAGTLFVAGTVGPAVLGGRVLRDVCRSAPAQCLATAAVTWSVLGGTSLTRVGAQVADALDAGDIVAARALVPSLCGRDPESLDAAGICRAAVESLAENTSDATVGPLVWGALGGIGGLIGYRAINTLDAMVGYRSPRYRNFGWAAARTDDIANLVPARLAGALTVVVGGAPRRAAAAWRADAHAHPSPNAGVVESAFAGALGVRLGGPTVYPHGTEDRPVLGAGAPPTPDDLRATVRLSRRVQISALVVALGLAALGGPRRRRSVSLRSAG